MALKPRALVITDEPRTRNQLAVRLGGRGYRALFAADADAAAQVARREHPRLVLVDMTMRGQKGILALERFDDRSFARTSVIALVGAGVADPDELDAELTRVIDAALAAGPRSVAA